MGTSVEVNDVSLETEFEKLTLYVGDLDSSVEESDLYNLFNEIAEVSSVRVCRDRNNGSSLGYAYVNFNHTSHAERAMEELNFKEVKGKAMRIMFSERDPSQRKSGEGNLFVKNLAESFDNKQLSRLFSWFGRIISCKVAYDDSGVSKGYGFVQFQSKSSAENAIKALHDKLVRQQKLHVGPFISRRQLEESPVFTNVYVKNLDESATDADLKVIFAEFGDITSAVVMRDGKGKSRKFGFVNFENAEAAKTAVEKMNGMMMGEKELYVGRAQKKKIRADNLRAEIKLTRDLRVLKGLNLYVKNLDHSVNDEKLGELFSEFGTINSSKVMVNSNGLSKGVAFVEFSTSEEASKAMKEMNGKMVGTKPIYVSLAQRKEDRIWQNVVRSTIAAPATMLPLQPPVRGYNYQPGSRLLNSLPAGPVPMFGVPHPFPFQRPTLYPYAPPVVFHGGMQPMISLPLPQPPLWNPYARV